MGTEVIGSHLKAVSKAYLASGLDSDQTSSSLEYIDALARLTVVHPTVWTDDYTSKTSADRRLRQLLKRGSQAGPQQFWDRLTALFDLIPGEVLPTKSTDASKLLHAMHEGVARRDESRVNLGPAYGAYLDVAKTLCARLSTDDDQVQLLEESILPIITQYLRPSPELSHWSVPPNSAHIVAQAMTLGTMVQIIETKWPEIIQQLTDDIKTSAPEQSKDYERSQNGLVQRASRLAILQKQIFQLDDGMKLDSNIGRATLLIIKEALEVISNRNGKPYGAAGAVAELLNPCRDLAFASTELSGELEEFVSSEVPRLALSPSSPYLIDILYSVSDLPWFGKAWAATLRAVLDGSDSQSKTNALEALLTSSKMPLSFDLALSDSFLQNHIKSNVRNALTGSADWDAFHRILQSPAKILAPETTDDIISCMTKSLSFVQEAPYALQGLRQVIRQNPSILRDFLSTHKGAGLLQSLLLASESSDEIVSRDAIAVNASIQTVLAARSDTKQSVYDLLQHGLKTADQKSVSIETLVELAKQLVKPGGSWEDMAGVLPSTNDWDAALAPFLETPPKVSLAITNPLGGAVYLVPQSSHRLPDSIAHDSDGYSVAFRIARYITRLFKDHQMFPIENVPSELRDTFVRNISFTIQLADDNLGLAGANGLWIDYNPDVEADSITFLADMRSFTTQEVKRKQDVWSSDVGISAISWASDLLARINSESLARSYYLARTYSSLVSDALEVVGWKNTEVTYIQNMLKTTRNSKGKDTGSPTFSLLKVFSRSFPLDRSSACLQRPLGCL